MGGRGAKTDYGTITTGSDGAKATFYDLTDKYKDMPLHEFENLIRDRKHEYIGLADEHGNIIIAGTSYKEGSVAVPQNHPDFNKARTLTHNHPRNKERPIGATFSDADVINHAILSNVVNQTRAVSSGKNENTYILKAGNGKINPAGLHKYASNISKKMDRIANEAIQKASKKFAKQGKKLTRSQANQIGLGSIKRVWKGDNVKKYGFDYIEVKKARW